MSHLQLHRISQQRILATLKQRPWLTLGLLGGLPFISLLVGGYMWQSQWSAPKKSPPVAIAPSTSVVRPWSEVPARRLRDFYKAQTAAQSQKATSGTPQTAATPAKKSTAQAKPSAPAAQAQKPAAQTAPAPVAANSADRWETAAGFAIDFALEMQVAIAENADSLILGTSTPGRILDMQGQTLRQIPAGQSYDVRFDGQGLDFGPWQVPTAVWVEPTNGGFVYVRDRWYRGRLLLVIQEKGLLAVNHVLLKDYLASVVGGEVSPSWPIEALKAQTIAARSYALTYYFRPANSLYHLGDTESYQVYGGLEKEADTTHHAVQATAGEFISYKGGIVESLYAASDDIVAAAHGGRGMSQLGALKLAEQGYNYLQILGTYYPGTGLSRIEVDQE